MKPKELPGIYARLDRAQTNFNCLDDQFRDYVCADPPPCALVPEVHKGGKGWLKVKIRTDLPDFRLLISDLICDTRFILDNLAYELVIAHTRKDPPPNPRRIEFPIFHRRADFMRVDKRTGHPAPGSGLAKIGDMDPWVQRVIENIQPYHATDTGLDPLQNGLYLIGEMCNFYKHRLLAPTILMPDTFQISFEPINCQVKRITTFDWSDGLVDNQYIAEFILGGFGPGASIEVATTPSFTIGVPPGAPAAGADMIKTACLGIQFVRAVVLKLTDVQWGTPIAIPDVAPYFTPEHTPRFTF